LIEMSRSAVALSSVTVTRVGSVWPSTAFQIRKCPNPSSVITTRPLNLLLCTSSQAVGGLATCAGV
jgi:hypothetical protein